MLFTAVLRIGKFLLDKLFLLRCLLFTFHSLLADDFLHLLIVLLGLLRLAIEDLHVGLEGLGLLANLKFQLFEAVSSKCVPPLQYFDHGVDFLFVLGLVESLEAPKPQNPNIRTHLFT